MNNLNSTEEDELDELAASVADQPYILMSFINKEGEVIWFMSDEISIKQEKMFQKLAVVSSSPSLILLLFLKIEILLLGTILWFENKFKKGK